MKNSTERSSDRRKRLREQGLKEVRNLWICPEQEELIEQLRVLIKESQDNGSAGEFTAEGFLNEAKEKLGIQND